MQPIDLFMRTNFEQKFGGDSVQVSKYVQHLTPRGFDFRLVPSHRAAQSRRGALAHIVNMDRPFELLAAAEVVRRSGNRVLLSSIHHAQGRIAAMDQSRAGLLGAVARGMGDQARLEWCKQAMRSRGSERFWLLRQPRSTSALHASVRGVLENVDRLLVLAPGELESLKDDFGFCDSGQSRVIPNGVDVDEAVRMDGVRDVDVLMVGRVEERKNQVAVLDSLVGTPDLRIVVAGELTARSPSFRRRFQELVEIPNVTWLGPVPPAELPSWYARSRVVVNATYVEVLSLVEMEALAYGCQLVGSSDGHSADYFGDVAEFVRAEAVVTQLPAQVERLAALGVNERGATLVRTNYTWSAVAERLAMEYEELQ